MDCVNPIILTYGRTVHTRLFNESWLSDEKAINRRIDIDQVYMPIQTKDRADLLESKQREYEAMTNRS